MKMEARKAGSALPNSSVGSNDQGRFRRARRVSNRGELQHPAVFAVTNPLQPIPRLPTAMTTIDPIRKRIPANP